MVLLYKYVLAWLHTVLQRKKESSEEKNCPEKHNI